jgi:hypothetical protein
MASAEPSASPPDEPTISHHCAVASHSSPFPSKGVAASNTTSTRLCFAGIISPLYQGCRREDGTTTEDDSKKDDKDGEGSCEDDNQVEEGCLDEEAMTRYRERRMARLWGGDLQNQGSNRGAYPKRDLHQVRHLVVQHQHSTLPS